ncbi:site-specific DNA-methyltransferase [Nocardioides marmoriginsengisoli]|uniref:Site-specific DNA-methyltransferase n=1 Tax=Nocardioides marmoriginsengisoli TaxID=661483 RepID=A0A3N0CQR2_9ACTN|nr:site-specific DNA-methyltransferase [Nocardioides marmoriginsengisoli]RNL65366.1 site-specific DNA-methyltransferase [Nocardioides marmoriginsengisoli]
MTDQPEVYGLTWPGKRAAAASAEEPTTATLQALAGESVDPRSTANLFIAGDNLEALKLLRTSHAGQVKLIYVDPPYNTGSEFIYADKFAGHAAWLSMMYPRLLLARDLLREDGVGFVSIDGNQVAQLQILLAEVFGEENVVATIVWVSNLKGRQLGDGGPAGTHEYILCFARDRKRIGAFRGSAAELKALMPAVYKGPAYEVKEDAKGPYVTKNELYNTNSKFNDRTAPSMVFRIHYNPSTAEVRITDLDDETTYPGFLVAMPHPNARPGLAWHAWRWSRAKILAEHDELEFEVTGETFRVRTKIRDVDGMTLKDLVIGPSTATAQTDLEELGLRRAFETPKPVALLELLIGACTSGDDLVLDFFAGSATTAHAVLARNHRDGGGRRFVMVQLDEECASTSAAAEEGFATIDAIGRERVRRAGAALRADGFAGDVGFKALRVRS